jgi:hypothetical protein
MNQTRARSEDAESEHAPLLQHDLLQLAQLARVREPEHKQFFDGVEWLLAVAWTWDRRAYGGDPSETLIRAAEAARGLHQAFGKLDPSDLECVNRLLKTSYFYGGWLRDLPQTIFRLAHLFSIAACMSAPRETDVAVPDHQKSGRDRTRKNAMFFELARNLKLLAADFNGKLGNARLLKAINILKPHMPEGMVPKNLSALILRKSILKTPLAIGADFYPYPELHV